ncbi:hypothetical protein BVRB_020560, partial [Beta vulgaris subsp. vulgaris]
MTYRAFLKEAPGHAVGRNPQDPVLAALPVPVPIGTVFPGTAFFPAIGLARGAVAGLVNADIDGLEWFYNVQIPGANLAQRQSSLELF